MVGRRVVGRTGSRDELKVHENDTALLHSLTQRSRRPFSLLFAWSGCSIGDQLFYRPACQHACNTHARNRHHFVVVAAPIL